MIGSVPQFPAFEKWQKMSENEQDALLAEIEKVRRRRWIWIRVFLALVCATVAVGMGSGLLVALVGRL